MTHPDLESAPRTAVPGAIDAAALSSMFQCVAGLRNLRAASAMFACFLLAVLLGGLIGAVGSPGAGRVVLGGLLAAVLFFAGLHAAGVLLMDQARGRALRSVVDAVVYGLLCVPRTIGLVIVLVLAVLLVNLAIAALFYLSKIPVLGVALFAVAFPAAVLAAGLATTAVLLGFQMALAAMWEGATLTAAMARALGILRQRLVESVLLLAVVAALAGVVAALVGSVLFFGFWPATGMAATIVGGINTGGLAGMSGSLLSGSGHAIAGVIGSGALWALAATLVFQVGLLGINLVYLRAGEGLDTGAMQVAMRARVEQARVKAAELAARAKEAGERARVQAQEAAAARLGADARAPTEAEGAAPAGRACPACQAPVAPVDVFCGACGHRLR